MTRRLLLPLFVLVCLGAIPASAAVRGDKTMYVGGTLTVPEKTKGRLDVSGARQAEFLSKKNQLLFTIPYDKISSMEYGQKAGRRVGLGIAVNPVFLFSKKRKHYLTVYFSDEQEQTQAAVFELAKGIVVSVVRTLEARSGKQLEFESEEARKHFEKEAK